MKEMDSLNLNKGLALMAMKGCPASSKETISQSESNTRTYEPKSQRAPYSFAWPSSG